MNEQIALEWFETLQQRFISIRSSRTGEHDVWSALFVEMRSAIESVFQPSHVVVRQWHDAVERAKKVLVGNRVQTPESWVKDELFGIFQTALSILKNGYLRSLADGIRAETVAQLFDQADALVRNSYTVAAMVIAGGALETHLRGLCRSFGLSWQGSGSIASYKQALDQARNQGLQSKVSSSDSSQIESWGKDRNEAAHSPANFTKTPQQVAVIIEGMRQFLGRTQ